MPAIFGDASQVFKLANDLSMVGARAITPMRAVMLDVGEAFVREWKANATASAGEHGKHYPDSIDATASLGITTVGVDVGPNPSMEQGGMSFEFGSRNQPPHLDGLRALDTIGPRAERMIDAATTRLFG